VVGTGGTGLGEAEVDFGKQVVEGVVDGGGVADEFLAAFFHQI
jgi:hypothetical protein